MSNGAKAKGSRLHFGHLVVIALVLTSFGPLSLGLSCAGIFYTPLAEHLGLGAGALSYYNSILWVASLLFLPLLGKLLSSLDARICVGGSVVLMTLCFVWLSFTNTLWHFYAGAFVMGLGVTMLLFLAPSTLINRWFAKKAGLFVGIVMAFTGVGGVVWSTVGGILINEIGWSATYLVFAALTLATLPTGILFISTSPEKKGLKPYGYVESEQQEAGEKVSLSEEGIEASRAFKMPAFFLIMVMCFFLNFGMYVYFMIPSYASTLALGAAMPLLGATASSVAMAGQTISKIVLGYVGDKKPYSGTIIGVMLGIAGVAGLALGGASAVMFYVAAFSYGVFYGITNVMTPILTKRAFGNRDYARIYSRISMAASLASALSAFVGGTLVDMFGFNVLFVGTICFMVITIAAVALLAKGSKPAQ